MTDPGCRCLLVSDFNVRNLAHRLENDDERPLIDAVPGPYGQVVPVLIDGGLDCWRGSPDCLVAWTRPESVIRAFNDLLAFRPVAIEDLLQQVDAYAAALLSAADKVSCLLVPSWVVSPAHRGHGVLDMRPGIGLTYAVERMNLRLCEVLAPARNVFVLDARRWLQAGGRGAFNEKLWFTAKLPFASEVFAEAAGEIKAALRAVRGETRKLLIVDLDDTLWGGVVGEAGWETLRLGGHDHVGEAYADFQVALKALLNRGVVLGIVSRNDERTALEAIARHPEMRLRRDDFAGWRINWGDKAKNVLELAGELRLGLSSVVFIDDNPVERARVREALPEVLVPDWPADPLLYASTLRSLACFDTAAVTAEDSRRAAMYAAERGREEQRQQLGGDLAGWLGSLHIAVKGEDLHDGNLARAVQLLNKTNQMNLATRRMTEAQLRAWAAADGHRVWAFRVTDRFGDSGLVGLASLAIGGARATVVDFVLSCRVMGRCVEDTMLSWLVQHARSAGATELEATCAPTPRNGPCQEFWQRSGFASDGLRFTWRTSEDYPTPAPVLFTPPGPAAALEAAS